MADGERCLSEETDKTRMERGEDQRGEDQRGENQRGDGDVAGEKAIRVAWLSRKLRFNCAAYKQLQAAHTSDRRKQRDVSSLTSH